MKHLNLVGAVGPYSTSRVVACEIHHPVFKGKPVNYDPRERFIAEFLAARGAYNIFHYFYRELVQALYEVGASTTNKFSSPVPPLDNETQRIIRFHLTLESHLRLKKNAGQLPVSH